MKRETRLLGGESRDVELETELLAAVLIHDGEVLLGMELIEGEKGAEGRRRPERGTCREAPLQ